MTARKSKYGPQGLTGRLATLEASGELTAERVAQSLKIPKKRAQHAIWSYRQKQKGKRRPRALSLHPGSAVASLVASQHSKPAFGEDLFTAVVDLIGIARAEALIAAKRARINALLKGAA